MLLADRFKLAIEEMIRRIAGRYDYAATYACTVVAQNADGTLELKPDAGVALPQMPGTSNIPIRYGIPGITVTVPSGARVSLVFDACDPGKPFAAIWDPGSLTSITVTAKTSVTINAPSVVLGGSGAKPVAFAQPVSASLQAVAAAMAALNGDPALTSAKAACSTAATAIQQLITQIATTNTAAQ